MAVVTLFQSTGPTLTGTFNSIATGGASVNPGGGTSHAVFTSCTCTDGSTLTAHPVYKDWIDLTTATTVRVPLSRIKSVV